MSSRHPLDYKFCNFNIIKFALKKIIKEKLQDLEEISYFDFVKLFDDKNKAKVDLFYIKVLDEIVKGAPSLKKIMLYSEKEFYRNYITSRFMRRSLTSFFL